MGQVGGLAVTLLVRIPGGCRNEKVLLNPLGRKLTRQAGGGGLFRRELHPPFPPPNCLLGVFSTHLDLGAQRIRDHWF